MIKTATTLIAGAVVATALIVSCSDDAPADADAAVCDCPAAEPPITGRTMRIQGVDGILPANGVGGAGADCPSGSTLITGWCTFENVAGTPPQLALVQVGSSPAAPNSWTCIWQNYNGGSAILRAEAVCLVPAQ